MNCPICGIRGGIKDTRQLPDSAVMRRYKCDAGHKWQTLEQIELVYDDSYVKAQQRETGHRLVAMREAREAEL
jgi:transcriptional regulator NrdR family protein